MVHELAAFASLRSLLGMLNPGLTLKPTELVALGVEPRDLRSARSLGDPSACSSLRSTARAGTQVLSRVGAQ